MTFMPVNRQSDRRTSRSGVGQRWTRRRRRGSISSGTSRHERGQVISTTEDESGAVFVIALAVIVIRAIGTAVVVGLIEFTLQWILELHEKLAHGFHLRHDITDDVGGCESVHELRQRNIVPNVCMTQTVEDVSEKLVAHLPAHDVVGEEDGWLCLLPLFVTVSAHPAVGLQVEAVIEGGVDATLRLLGVTPVGDAGKL